MPDTHSPLVVYKLGGSLLERPHLATMIRETLIQRPGRGALLVVGGGKTADLVREWDRVHALGDEAAHWLALESMRLNEALLAQLLPELRTVRNARQVAAALADQIPAILCADCFLRWGESIGHPPLPHTWQTTSDSIAAWAARILEADELVLMKSTTLLGGQTLEQAAQAGLVDSEFPNAAAGIPRLSWVDGSRDHVAIEPWR